MHKQRELVSIKVFSPSNVLKFTNLYFTSEVGPLYFFGQVFDDFSWSIAKRKKKYFDLKGFIKKKKKNL